MAIDMLFQMRTSAGEGHQIAAGFHDYAGQVCDTPACWRSTLHAPHR